MNFSRSENKRIALFLPSLHGGGAERIMLNIAEGLIARGESVDVVVVRAEGDLRADLSPVINVIDLDCKHAFQALLKLISYLRKEEPSVILATPCHVSIIALSAKLFTRVRTRVIVREANTLSHSLKSLVWWKAFVLRSLIKILYKTADGVIAVSKGVADDLSRTLGMPLHRIKTIYNPTIMPTFDVEVSKPVRHRWYCE
ncbi:MAG: glycosyltransferase, partial [Syntrophaceae bacterium]|nr:glycosyltransferase [Syntrophaceae bacterium]